LALVYSNAVDPLASSRSLTLSPDGQRFAYATLAAGALGGRLYLADLQTGTNDLIDAATSAVYPGLRFSRDGVLLAYTRYVNTTNQLCLYNIQTKSASVLNESYSPPGMPQGSANSLTLSPDARLIVYRSPATNGLANPAGNIAQLFLYDRQTGRNTLLTTSRLNGDASDNFPLAPSFSDDGQTLVFQSWASDLASQDFNQSSDVFAFSFFYLAISNTNPPNQGPRLSWPAAPGANYHVQFTDRLPDGAWQVLPGTITNFANKAWLLDPAPPPGQRFYRVYSF
jgi:Tol biopolymer transport system component